MIRLRLLLVPLAAVLVAGCGTFTDGDAVARYDDVELSAGRLEELMSALSPPEAGGDTTNGNAAREVISLFVRIEAVKDRLAAEGFEVTPAMRDEATTQMGAAIAAFDELSPPLRDYLVDAQAAFVAFAEVSPPSEDDLRALYEQGPQGSGVTCLSHILVETEAEADDVVAQLAGGAGFAELAGELSIDTGSGAQGGALPCNATESVATTYVEPFATAALAAEIGVVTEPVRSDFGFHVIRLRTFDEARAELESFFSPQEFAISRAIEGADVFVDPRYGTLVGGIVVPLS